MSAAGMDGQTDGEQPEEGTSSFFFLFFFFLSTESYACKYIRCTEAEAEAE